MMQAAGQHVEARPCASRLHTGVHQVKSIAVAILAAMLSVPAAAQIPPFFPNLTRQQTYTPHLASSTDPEGANFDLRVIPPGATLTVLNVDGPGEITHLWFTMDDDENYALKRVVLKMYWDGDKNPSVLAPIGDFFGLGLGLYHTWDSLVLSVAPDKSLNSFFPMPFERHARITVTNEGHEPVTAFYYNVNYRTYDHKLPDGTLYFHAEYRQAQPNPGWTNEWVNNQTPRADCTPNFSGQGNYVFLDTKGHGQYVGLTFSVLQNQDSWWGEGDAMFFIDGSKKPVMYGTGSEDYFHGAWGFGGARNQLSQHPFSYPLYGAPIVGSQLAGSRSSLYRFDLHSPVPFHTSFKGTIEHGSGNDRSDNFYSVAYWYQAPPQQAPLPALPPVNERIPALQPVGGPGNAGRGPYMDLNGRPDGAARRDGVDASVQGAPSQMRSVICKDYRGEK